jgi:endonuclease YncB( thermonuclease family)
MLRELPLLFLLTTYAALADTLNGRARILDGDTIEIGSERIRLFGIDAPEGAQGCIGGDGKSFPCGEAATKRLKAMTEGLDVRCEGSERD